MRGGREKPFTRRPSTPDDRSRRVEEFADFGRRRLARPRIEVRRQAARVSRLEKASLQQDDRRTISLAPDRTAGRLEGLVHGREDVCVVVSLRVSELAGGKGLQLF